MDIPSLKLSVTEIKIFLHYSSPTITAPIDTYISKGPLGNAIKDKLYSTVKFSSTSDSKVNRILKCLCIELHGQQAIPKNCQLHIKFSKNLNNYFCVYIKNYKCLEDYPSYKIEEHKIFYKIHSSTLIF